MITPLRVLGVEGKQGDLQPCLAMLRQGGLEVVWQWVGKGNALAQALTEGGWDLLICRHVPPTHDAIAVLNVLKGCGSAIPAILIADTAAEETVTAAMRAGAQDFISLGHLDRLVPAIRLALKKAGAPGERGHAAGPPMQGETWYSNLFMENPTPTLLVEASTLLVVDANPAAARFFGHRWQALRTASIQALSRAPHAGWMSLRKAKHVRSHFFTDQVIADGRVRDLDVYAVRIECGGQHLLLATLFDRTDRESLATSEAMIVAAVEQLGEAIAITDPEGKIAYTNRAFQTLTGFTPSLVKGWALVDLLERDEIREGIRQAALGNAWEGSVSIRKERGSTLEVDITCSPLRIREGVIQHLVLVMRDVTKEAELERGLRQSHKMEALGTLAAGIAHDSNDILTSILTAAELAKWKLPADSPILPKLDVILQAALCAAGLNKQILTFSRQSEEKHLPLDLSALVREALHMLRSTLAMDIDVQSDLASGIWVEGDTALFQQIVLNLAINAVHSMRSKGGTIRVSLSEMLVDERNGIAGLAFGRYALLKVLDTGCGMDMATQDRVFDPFFTTKSQGEGSGLGLSVVQATVLKAGGVVKVSSEPGKGSEFCIYWPCATGEGFSKEDQAEEDVGGGESLLLVEDEELVAALAKLGLQNLGYSVTTCTDPVAALEMFKMHPDAYDLIFTDLAMPKLSGVELAGKLQAIRPSTPIILVSGMPLASALEGQARFHGFVPKPFTAYDLAAAARRALALVAKAGVGVAPEGSQSLGEGLLPEGAVVLLAEDSHTTRSMIRMWLEEMGCQVVEARDGQEAWDLFLKGPRQGYFALVLTDVVMPRMDGLELTHLIRRSDPSLPIAILTSNEDKETLKSALNLGVNEYLNKPFEPSELVQCVESLLKLSRSRQTTRRSAETAQAVRLAQKTLVAIPEKDVPLFSLYEPLSDAGGDVFRCMRCADGSILFMLADVAGHSVLSSYAVASFLGMISSHVGECTSLMARTTSPGSWDANPVSLMHCCGHYGKIPCNPLRHLALKFNQAIQSGPFSEIPICLLMGLWDPAKGQLQLLNAGIPHGLLALKALGEVRPIAINGTPLGIFPELAVEESSLQLEQGDRLLFGTDGFFDVVSVANQYFQEMAPGKWGALGSLPIDAALSLICEEARNHGSGVIADDLLVIGFEQPALTQARGDLMLRLPSIPRAVDMACDRLSATLDGLPLGAGLAKERIFDILLAVREALTNAMIHGNRNRPEAFVDLRVRQDLEHRALKVSVVDEGTGFQLAGFVPPCDPLSDRGRGIPLILAYAQDVQMADGALNMTFQLEEMAHGNG